MLMDMKTRNRIKKEALFLEELGYKKSEDECSINYFSDNILISIILPPHSEESDVLIRFSDKNQVFSLGWIALVRNNLEGTKEKEENVIELIKYLKKNYDRVTSYQFCLRSNNLIDEYVKRNHTQFEKSVEDFLKNI